MRYFLFLLLPVLLFGHKLNLFLDLEGDNLFINSYFGNGKPCKNCKFMVQTKDGAIYEGKLDEKGEYYYKTTDNYFKVTVDGGSFHIAMQEIERIADESSANAEIDSEQLTKLMEENRILQQKIHSLEQKLDYSELFKVMFGLAVIGAIFLLLKRVKS